MGKKLGHSAEEIIRKLRQADVLLSQSRTVAEICREIGYQMRRIINGARIMAA